MTETVAMENKESRIKKLNMWIKSYNLRIETLKSAKKIFKDELLIDKMYSSEIEALSIIISNTIEVLEHRLLNFLKELKELRRVIKNENN